MLLSINGLVTKSINIGENNKILSILTPDQGVIYAFVNNCKQLKSSLLAACEIMSYCKFIIFKNKEKYIVNDAEIINQFPMIRTNIDKLSLSCYFLELVSEIAHEGTPSDDYLKLILNSLYLLNQSQKKLLLIKSAVEFRFMSIAGYQPNLICCNNCSTVDPNLSYFFSINGYLICVNCKSNIKNLDDVKTFPLSKGVLAAMKFIIYSPLNKIFSFDLSEKDLASLSLISQSYLIFKTDMNLNTLEYFNNIILKQ